VTTSLRPNTELVAVAWLAGITGLSSAMVATQLPGDVNAWMATGFLTARNVAGTPSMYTPLRSPVLVLDAWAVSANTARPPWFQANSLMEAVRDGCIDPGAHRWVELPGNYEPAQVTSAYLLTEPQRVYNDEGAFARYTANLALHWVAAT
jgi:hypothetical protein